MHFNADKFECLRFWAKPGDAPDHTYIAPDDAPIEVKPHLRDLGVQVSSDLTFQVHVTMTVASASRLAGWGLRTFRRRSSGLMKTLWKCLIQPKLDYCSQLWSPNDQDTINMIEKVQRHFLSTIAGLGELNHWERLKKVSLYSQERRRERYMVIFIWKISEGLVKGYTMDFTDSERRGRLAVVRPHVASAPAAVRRAREASLGVKGSGLFNLLPATVRNMRGCTADVFKTALDKFLSTIPDQPSIGGLARAADNNSLLHQVPMQAAQVQFDV